MNRYSVLSGHGCTYPTSSVLGNGRIKSTFEEQIKEAEFVALPNETVIPVDEQLSIQRTEKRKKSLRPWLLYAQRKEVLKESKYLSGFHPMKHTGNKAEILPTCLEHPSNYVIDRLKCKQCTRELDLYVDMLKDAGSYKEQEQIK